MYLIVFFFTIIFVSCSDRSVDDLISSIPVTEEIVTYDNTIASIINSNCIACHATVPQNGAPMPLTNYSEVTDAIINRGLNSRIDDISFPIPPTGLMLSANIIIIQEWIDNGFPEN